MDYLFNGPFVVVFHLFQSQLSGTEFLHARLAY